MDWNKPLPNEQNHFVDFHKQETRIKNLENKIEQLIALEAANCAAIIALEKSLSSFKELFISQFSR